MAKVITTTFQLRRGHAAWYEENNPVLAQGEPAFELDTNKLKIGDGVTEYNNLEYINKDLYYLSTATVNGNTLTLTNNSGEIITFSVDDGEQIGKFGTGEKAEIHNDLENNIANGDYSFTEGTSSIKPFSYTEYTQEEEVYIDFPYGTIDNWVYDTGMPTYLIDLFNYKLSNFNLPLEPLKIFTSENQWEFGSPLKASDFPNHRFMLGDGYNTEINEAYYSNNYTNWIYVFDDPENEGNIYLRAEDDINGNRFIFWGANASIKSPYVFIDQNNAAIGHGSHVEGAGNISYSERGHIEGRHNKININSSNSHIEGFGNVINSGNSAHIEGERNLTIGTGAGIHIEGRANVSEGANSHVEGRNNFAHGACSTVNGFGKRYVIKVNETIVRTTSSATNTSSIEISLPVEDFNDSVTMPAPDTATGVLSWGIWYINKTKAIARRIGSMYKQNDKLKFTIRTIAAETITIDPTDDTYFYWGNSAYGVAAIAGGKESYAYGNYSIALGEGAVTNIEGQIAIGKYNNINNSDLLVIGKGTDVLNRADALTLAQNGDITINGNETVNGTANLDKIILGQGTVSGTNSIASGVGASATGTNSIAIGKNTKASGAGAIAIGTGSGNTTASGSQSVALGNATTASNKNTIAAGISSVASHETSFAFGNRITTGADFSFNIGYYNNPTNNTLFSVGNGTNTTRSNALLLDRSGNLTVAGTVSANGENINDELENVREIIKLLKNASFSISGYFSNNFDFINGMTWEQFVNSPFNPTCDPWSIDYQGKTFDKIFGIVGNLVIVEYNTDYTAIQNPDYVDVAITDIITNNTTYYTADA